MNPRVDYDRIAHLYDDDAMRQKQPDADMLALAERPGRRIRALDIACGTGNQLAANRRAAPEPIYVGLDRHGEMIRRAASKDRAIGWVHGDGAQLPFRDGAFDYVSNQWAFHHVRDKIGMLRETHRVLARGGGFTMVNQEPRRMPDWPLYAYFPESHALDLSDFMAADALVKALRDAGFRAVEIARRDHERNTNLEEWAASVAKRSSCSQLWAISDDAYDAGMRRVRRDLATLGGGSSAGDLFASIKIHARR